MLKKILLSTYLYLIIIVGIGFFYIAVLDNLFLDYKIVILMLLALVPLIDGILDSISRENNGLINQNFSIKDFSINSIILILIGGLINAFFEINVFTLIVLLIFVGRFIFNYDNRYLFLGALISLAVTGLFLIIGDKSQSELFSIQGYYLLILGVIGEIYDSITNKESYNSSDKNITTQETPLQDITDTSESLVTKTIANLKNKYSILKNNILEEMGEVPENKPTQNIETTIEKNIHLEGGEKIDEKANFYIRLISYFGKKTLENIGSITIITYILLILTSLTALYYATPLFQIFLSIIFVISYLVSKNIGLVYNSYRGLHIENSSRYFYQKIIVFSSIGALGGYNLVQYMNFNTITALHYFFFFFVFALLYVSMTQGLFIKMGSLLSNSGKRRKAFSIKTFLIKNMYTILTTFFVFVLLGFIGIKTGITADIAKWNQERKGYESFIVLEDEIEEEITNDNFNIKTAEEIERIIAQNRGFLDENGFPIETDEGDIFEQKTTKQKILTPVSEVYNFTEILQVGSNSEQVIWLEDILSQFGYFEFEPDRAFGEGTKASLTQLLQEQCGWSESTQGILGPQAQECLYSLEIEVEDFSEESRENNFDFFEDTITDNKEEEILFGL